MRLRRNEQGIALPAVLCLGVVMMALIGTALGVVVSGLQQATSDQDSAASLDAAYAGVADYMARLNLNPSYVQDGNQADLKFGTCSTTHCPQDSSNRAFSIGTGTPAAAWATVPGSDPQHPAYYRYEVDNSKYASTGTVRLRATGMVGSSVRSVLVEIDVDGFFKYVYFTDYETQDPTFSGHPQSCHTYAWAGRDATTCGSVQFGANDQIQGDLRSNDTIVSCSAKFYGQVKSASTAKPVVQRASGCATNGTFYGGEPQQVAAMTMPESNSTMQTEAAQGTTGCVFTGPTTVTYYASGKMLVVSPWTKFTHVDGATHDNPARCVGTSGNLDALHTTGVLIDQLSKSLFYVQSVPTLASDPNHWDAAATPPDVTVAGRTYSYTCLGADGTSAIRGSSGNAGWSLTSRVGSGPATAVLRQPLAGEAPATGWTGGNASLWNTVSPAYGCTNGDLYVSGQVKTQTTASAQNYVYITGDLTLVDISAQVLGLVGTSGVIVANPMRDAHALDQYGDEAYTAMIDDGNTGRKIDAAILAVKDTFAVQNYDRGDPRGTLTVRGSIAQEYRGPVGTAAGVGQASGYAKFYTYDPLLQTTAPPYFLAPSSTTFSVSRYSSIPAAFSRSGAQQ